jgi:hypothetical protein
MGVSADAWVQAGAGGAVALVGLAVGAVRRWANTVGAKVDRQAAEQAITLREVTSGLAKLAAEQSVLRERLAGVEALTRTAALGGYSPQPLPGGRRWYDPPAGGHHPQGDPALDE